MRKDVRLKWICYVFEILHIISVTEYINDYFDNNIKNLCKLFY